MEWQILTASILAGLAGIAAVLSTGLKDILKELFAKKLKSIKKQTYINQLEKLAEFLEIIESIHQVDKIDRVLIFSGHNCGGLPSPGKPYTVRALTGWSKEKFKNPLKSYDFDIPVDAHYTRLLEDMIKNGRVVVSYEDMPKDSKLRGYYLLEGVKFSYIYFLGIVDQDLIYLSAASYSDPIDEKSITSLELSVDQLRAVIGESK